MRVRLGIGLAGHAKQMSAADVPNWSFVMYEGDGGVTFRVELRSLDLLRANMADVWTRRVD